MVISGEMCLSTASHFLKGMLSLSHSFPLSWPDNHVLAQEICWAVCSWQACASIPTAAGTWYLKPWMQPTLLPWGTVLPCRLPVTCLTATMNQPRDCGASLTMNLSFVLLQALLSMLTTASLGPSLRATNGKEAGRGLAKVLLFIISYIIY